MYVTRIDGKTVIGDEAALSGTRLIDAEEFGVYHAKGVYAVQITIKAETWWRVPNAIGDWDCD